MLEITSTLRYLEFKDIKTYTTSKGKWDAIHKIYGRENNVLRAKEKSLREKFDEMRMQEGEAIVWYCARIKDVVNKIIGAK